MARPDSSDHRARQRIIDQLANIDFAMPGTLLTRWMPCGKPNCRCKADPPQLHGPYHQWTRKIDGKTRTVRLTTEQADRYQHWFDNAKTIRTLTAELEALTNEIATTTEDWT